MIPIEKVKLIVDTYEILEKRTCFSDIDKKFLLKNLKNIQILEKLLMKQEVI